MSDSLRQLSRKTLQRHRLAESIIRHGYEVMPCSRCSSRGLRCHMSARSSKCAECARSGKPCNASGVAISSRVWFWSLVVFLLTWLQFPE
jgi:hypothetical protein